jgi:hypothetical protein
VENVIHKCLQWSRNAQKIWNKYSRASQSQSQSNVSMYINELGRIGINKIFIVWMIAVQLLPASFCVWKSNDSIFTFVNSVQMFKGMIACVYTSNEIKLNWFDEMESSRTIYRICTIATRKLNQTCPIHRNIYIHIRVDTWWYCLFI